MIYIYPWHMESKGARAVRSLLPEARIIKHQQSGFQGAGKTVINWGSSQVSPEVSQARVINEPTAITVAANKLKFFKRVSSLKNNTPRIPDWTTELAEAVKWSTEGHEVVGRQVLEGHSGVGIIFSSDGINDAFKDCKLYVKYVKKRDEFRIHIAFGKVIVVQRKALRTTDDSGNPIDKTKIDWRVRNLANGFIFQQNDVNPPEDVIEQAIRAIKVVGLDFGAVDVIWNDHEKQAYVLEINTAPGLEGSTVNAYAEAFRANLL